MIVLVQEDEIGKPGRYSNITPTTEGSGFGAIIEVFTSTKSSKITDPIDTLTGIVTDVRITTTGSAYKVNDTLTIAASDIGRGDDGTDLVFTLNESDTKSINGGNGIGKLTVEYLERQTLWKAKE